MCQHWLMVSVKVHMHPAQQADVCGQGIPINYKQQQLARWFTIGWGNNAGSFFHIIPISHIRSAEMSTFGYVKAWDLPSHTGRQWPVHQGGPHNKWVRKHPIVLLIGYIIKELRSVTLDAW